MKRPAVFFDRDNTLIVSDGYLGDPDKVVLMDGAADAVARARQLGFATVIVSNQSGVARGMFEEDAVHAVNERLDEMLRDQNEHAVIDRHEFCPYHPEATVERYRQDSDLRKPRAGMILRAADALALDLERSWLVGDAPRDIEAGKAAGCRTILFTPPGVAASPAADESSDVKPDHAVHSLKNAIEYIAAHRTPGDGEEERKPTMSIPHHPHIPPRVESAAREDDPSAQAPLPPMHAHDPASRPDRDKRLLGLAEQILDELRRSKEQPVQDFSVTKMLAGITQVLTLAVLFMAYLNRGNEMSLQNTMIFALVLQTMTIALLVMNRQR
jgi:D-glycero-D-manno-heptose 1,7-bisphosphate phosphatase